MDANTGVCSGSHLMVLRLGLVLSSIVGAVCSSCAAEICDHVTNQLKGAMHAYCNLQVPGTE